MANLKQNLKHTTEQTMQLDTAIEQRKREVDNVSNDINNEKANNENNAITLNEQKLNLLSAQIDQNRTLYQRNKLKLMGDRYNEIATSKYT